MQKNVPHIENLLSKLYNLKRDRGSCWEKPYKSALRLALIDLMEQSTSPARPEPVERNDRLEDLKELLKLDGRNVLLPKEKRFWPADHGLQWRWERLRKDDIIRDYKPKEAPEAHRLADKNRQYYKHNDRTPFSAQNKRLLFVKMCLIRPLMSHPTC
ncbi:MAG: hypothetical protein CML13_16730 [Puniceicoccaceae bacterium]|nr:hypothetical protein [Puniceicoccaceae bacterium]|tara:strand:+ start:2290 stop:2760 length:471 start_codon:yes stop_codon:yes gene_type:complete